MSNIKATLRERFSTARQNLHDHQRVHLDRRICAFLLRYLDDLDALQLGAYSPFRGEPNLVPALEVLYQAARRIHFPVINDDLDGDTSTAAGSQSMPVPMQFRRWRPDAELTKNRFGIAEPRKGLICPVQSLDVVFMPLLAFSTSGVRLGMGGGYYDRTFAEFLNQPTSGPLRVGVAYSFQQSDSLPRDPWDVPLDAVITDRGCHDFNA